MIIKLVVKEVYNFRVVDYKDRQGNPQQMKAVNVVVRNGEFMASAEVNGNQAEWAKDNLMPDTLIEGEIRLFARKIEGREGSFTYINDVKLTIFRVIK